MTLTKEEYTNLILENQDKLKKVIRKKVSNTSDAEDVFQETILAIFQNTGSFQEDAEFMPWAATIARNKSIDFLRQKSRNSWSSLVEQVESADDETRESLFDQFVSRVQAEEVAPEEVEKVAANILNLRNQNVTLTPEQAESVISLSLYAPDSAVSFEWDSMWEMTGALPKRRFPPRRRKPIDPDRLKALGERLKIAFESDDKMNEIFVVSPEIRKLIRFRLEDGLKVAIDMGVKEAIDAGKFEQLARDLGRLEQQKMLIWQKDLAHEMKIRMERRHKELENIHELTKLGHLEKMKEFHALRRLESLESLKQLEALGFVPNFDSDSIRIVIEKSVKEAIKQAEMQDDQ